MVREFEALSTIVYAIRETCKAKAKNVHIQIWRDIIDAMKLMFIWLSLAAITTHVSWAQKGAAGHHNISAISAKKLVSRFKQEKKTLVILDVRTPEEYKNSHIAGARLMDFLADDFKASLGKLDKTKVYLLHCRSGSRSSSAFALMKRLGFQSVYHLDGGIIAWRKAVGKKN